MNSRPSMDRELRKRISLFLLAIAIASCICGAIPQSRARSDSNLLGSPTAGDLIRGGNLYPAGTTYTWIGTIVNTDWTNPLNWSPVRPVPAATDTLIFDVGTPSPIVTNVAGAIAGTNETIAELHIASGVSPTFSTGGANTLTINAGSGVTGFDVSSLAISGSNALRIELAPGTVGNITGFMSVAGGGHRLISNDPSGITFQNDSIFTTTTGFGGNAFGDGSAGNGAAGSIVFAAGSAYFHNAGSSPFGASGSASVVTFQTGSEADYLTATGFDASGRTYANLIIGNASTAVNASASGTGNFQFDNLTINAAGSNNSSITFSGSGTSAITIQGDITSNGAGAGTLPEVILTPGSGGLVINKPGGGTITFGNDLSNSRSIDIEGNASVGANTALVLSRVLQLGFSNPNNKTLTVNGTLNGGASAYVIGSVLKTFSNSVTSNIFEVGTPNGYSPIDVSGVSGTGSLTINANQSQQPNITGNALKRYWKIASSGGITSADLTFHYLAGDVVGTESNYKIFKYNGSFTQFNPNVLNTTSHFATLTNATSFSDWTLAAIPDTPSVTNATTNEDTQSTTGLVITRNVNDGPEVTHFKITNITGGTLFKNDGATVITNNSFITEAEGNAGLKFTPAANSLVAGSFQVQSSTDAVGTVLSAGAATATITVSAVADTPSVTDATTNEDTQTTSGLVISRNAADGAEVTHFKVTGITNGTLFKNNGTTPINNNDFITFAEGNAGLRFTPAANLFSPGATFSFAVQAATSGAGAGLSSGSATATITVNTVADTPSVTNATTNEDTQTTTGLVLTRNPADGAEVTHFKVTGISGGTLFQNNGVTVINNGDFITVAQGGAGLKFTPTADSNASGSFQAQASLNNTNAGLGGNLATATITVNAVNDTPSFVKGADQTVNEDAGAQTVAGWGTAISSGPANESGQTVSFNVSNNNNSLFSGQPAVGSTGALTFTPAANANGAATVSVSISDNGGTANGGVDTSTVQTFTITVNAVNDAPSFTKGPDQTVNEDAAAQTVNNWATGISPGPADETGQTVNFQVTGNTNAALFSALPAISSTGTLTYTPAANANGAATITISVMDNGGTALGGADTSAGQTFNITVNAVNDTPSFVKGADQTVNEDAGAQTVAGWGTAISSGPANESGQTVSFNVSNNNNSLFSGQPAVGSTGTLTFTPAANANGTATVSVSISDNGGTANGGVDTSTVQTFTITVNAVNDVPSFTEGPDQTIQDPNPQSVPNWATNISAGPADESGQTLTFLVTNDSNVLFSAQPAISPNGTLTFTAAAGQDGVATVTVQLMDSGGTANGGVDTSAAQTFTITVHALNNPPTLDALADVNINEEAPLQTVNLSGITPGPSFESAQTLTITATSSNPALIPNPGVTYTSPNTTGSISFTPLANANGSALITVTVKDTGGTANGGVDTFSRTFTVTVNPVNDAPVNSVPGAQNGTLNATLVFSAANANLISISDVDAGSDPVQVTLNATDGTLTLSTTSGLSFITGDGTDDPLMSFTGSIANINAALAGMGNLAFGTGVIEITTNDLGRNGAGGPLSDTDTIQVTVIDNLAPVLLTAAGTDRAIALDSVTMLRDPFSLLGDHNFSSDHRTRITLFALHAQLKPGETASAITAEAEINGTIVPLIVESVRTVPGFDWLTQVVVRFPDGFSTGGGGPVDAKVRIHLRGANSNQAVVTIVPAP